MRWVLPGLVVLLLDRGIKAIHLFRLALLDGGTPGDSMRERLAEAPLHLRLAVKISDGLAKVYSFLSGGETPPVQPPVTQNTGMAFGMFQGNSAVILAVSVLLVIGCALLLRGMRVTGWAPVALSLMAGGALGNMIDRVAYGYVIDMFPFFGWFVFNVADVGVVAGAILCGISLLFRPRDWSGK